MRKRKKGVQWVTSCGWPNLRPLSKLLTAVALVSQFLLPEGFAVWLGAFTILWWFPLLPALLVITQFRLWEDPVP